MSRSLGTGEELTQPALYDITSLTPLDFFSTSLSNLDQDLPNFVSPQVPIFSLPQEWLWCESWCSLESKRDAKTIDLCNNPLKKEPKLDMAKRIVAGEVSECERANRR